MLFYKDINSYCKDVVYVINKCCNYTNCTIKIFNLKMAIHVLTHKSASQRPI